MPNHRLSITDSHEYSHTIDGRSVLSEQFIDVIDPASGTVFASAPSASKEQLDEAVSAAQRAYLSWRKMTFSERRIYLERFSQSIKSNAGEIAKVLTHEQGKPLFDARGEINGAAREIVDLCQTEPQSEMIRWDSDIKAELHYRPLGVVGAITPWNYPILLAAPKIAHALFTGNTVVLKPSPYTPLSTLLIGELAQEALPPGVLNVLSGGNELGRWMTLHPQIARIAFTGSVATGKQVFASASGTMKRLSLELGGNDPAILLEDIDLDTVAKDIFDSAMNNAGQVCISVKRVYAPESLYEPLIEHLYELAKNHRVGNGFVPKIQMGPIQNKMQFEKVLGIIADAAQHKGTRVISGGQKFDGNGYFVAPTIVADPTDDMRIVAEEQFGPVLPVLKYKYLEDAIKRANNSRYGLAASVWTKDVDYGEKVAAEIEAGSVWINHHTRYEPEYPFGGFKESGYGREMGQLGLLSYMEPQVICTAY